MAFTYQQILDDILAKTNIRAIIAINPYANEGQSPCPYGKNNSNVIGAGHTQEPLTVTVLDVQGDKCERRNVQIVVYDRSAAQETAYYSQDSTPDSMVAAPDVVLNQIRNHVNTVIGATNYDILSYNSDQRSAVVAVWIDTATTCTKKQYRVFRTGLATFNSREVV